MQRLGSSIGARLGKVWNTKFIILSTRELLTGLDLGQRVGKEGRPQPIGVAQEFVNCKIQPGKVVVFNNPTFLQPLLVAVDITATNHTNKIQDYLKQLTGARTVP
ncbi:hypothetical protein H8959_010266 [Pygathrix nigripes]